MRDGRALLSLIFILFIAFPVTDMGWVGRMEFPELTTGDPPANQTEGKVNRSDAWGYRDGVVDNFDYFVIRGYPSGFTRSAGIQGVDNYAMQNGLGKMRKK